MKSVRAAADSFRKNPSFDTAEAITELGTGEAVISPLDAKGRPCVAEKAVVLPPQSMMGTAKEEDIAETIRSDSYFGKYEDTVDRRSAYEIIKEDAGKEEADEEDDDNSGQGRKKTGKKTSSGPKKASGSKKKTAAKKAASKVSGSLFNSIGREIGRSIARGLLGIIKK